MVRKGKDWKEWPRDENPPTAQCYMNDRKISGSKPYFPSVSLLRLRRRGERNCPNPCFLVRFKSDENNIRQRAIHLFSNRPIYYLLFD